MNKPSELPEASRMSPDQVQEVLANIVDTRSVSNEVRVLLGEGKEYSPSEILETVQDILIDALGLDDDEPRLDAEIYKDFGAESLDYLDISYRLEKTFRIKIPRNDIFTDLKESVSEVDQIEEGSMPVTVRNIVEYIVSRSKINGAEQ